MLAKKKSIQLFISNFLFYKKKCRYSYHEHEQQQHQQKQHGFCDGRCKGPTFELVSGGPVNAVVNGPPCVPEPMPRSRHPAGSSDTLQDILKRKSLLPFLIVRQKKLNIQKEVAVVHNSFTKPVFDLLGRLIRSPV